MSNCIDVHIIVLDNWPGQKQLWYDQCLKSISNSPINIYTINGTWFNIGIGRYNGFLMGNSKYVSFIDPDDIIPFNTFEYCNYLIKTYNPDILVTNELKMCDDFIDVKSIKLLRDACDFINYFHHLIIVKRTILESNFEHFKIWPHTGDMYLWVKLLTNPKYNILFTNFVGYYYRQRSNPARSIIQPSSEHRIEYVNMHQRAFNNLAKSKSNIRLLDF